MNTNPALLIAQAVSLARKTTELKPLEENGQHLELRVYDPTGSGYHFVRGYAAGRWYYMREAGADGFQRADLAALDAAIAAGARVQLVGYHARNLGLWQSWADFARSVGGQP
jgi:hypothetical protein